MKLPMTNSRTQNLLSVAGVLLIFLVNYAL
jgi:LPXTG-motif cell wall-anchored protein